MTTRSGRWALGLAIALGAVGGLAAPASAHATLQSTNPASGAVVPTSPGDVVLRFDEQVAYSFNSVEVFDSRAKRVDTGGTRHPTGDSHAVEVAVPRTMPAGGYVVTWRVISADSHPVHGAFTFFVGAGGGSGLRNEAALLLSKTAGSRTVGIVFGITRFLAFASVALLVGGALFAIAIWPGAREDRRARRLIWSGLIVLFASSAAAFALQGPYGEGLGIAQAVKPSVMSGVWHTTFGHAYAARLGLLLAGAAVLIAILRRRVDDRLPAPLVGVAAVVGVGILATWGLAGHAATGSWVPLAVVFDVLHIGAAAVWVGGLAMAVVAVLPSGRRDAAGSRRSPQDAMVRFSQWALASVIVIAGTGLFAAWREVGISWGALTTTSYGKLVIYKSVGFGALIALAVGSRSMVHGELAVPFVQRRTPQLVGAGPVAVDVDVATPALRPGPDARWPERLRTAVVAEVLVGLIVLALTALLVNARPAFQAYAAPFSTEVKAGPDLVDAVVDPAKAGPLTIHMYILTADGAQANVPEVGATMSNARGGISGLVVPLRTAGPGHFLTTGFAVPIPGSWTINVTVRTDEVTEYQAQPITVHIR